MQNIIYVNEASWIGGAEGALLDLVTNLGNDYSPCVVCPGEGEFPDSLRTAGIDTQIVSFYGIRARNPLRFFETLWRLRSVVCQNRASLIHVNHQYFSNYGVILGKICRLPVIVHLRGVETDEFFDGFARWIIQADRVICVSKAVRTRFLDYVNSHMRPSIKERIIKRTMVVYDGLKVTCQPMDHNVFCREFGIDTHSQIIGIVGQVVPEKGIRDFIDAAKIVLCKKENIHFVVVGADTQPGRDFVSEMLDYTNQLGINDSFTFTGFRNDAASLIGAFDVSVLASWQDAFPRVVLESLAIGVPVIATRVGGVPEIIEDGVSGFLVPSHDSIVLAEIILQVLELPRPDKMKMINQGRKSLSRFNIKRHAKEIQSIYRDFV